MDELDRGMAISVQGPERERILRLFHEQMSRWAVALPEVEPLVLDFGLGEFERTGLIECWIANERAAGYCGKYLFLFDGQCCATHHHIEKTETFFVVKGSLEVTGRGSPMVLREGDVLRLEPGQAHGMKGLGPCLFLELSTPCSIEDNVFEDGRIPIGRGAGRPAGTGGSGV